MYKTGNEHALSGSSQKPPKRPEPEAGGSSLAMSIAEVAQTLSIGRTHVYTLVNSGRLRTVKLGRRTLVVTESVTSLLKGA